MPVYQDKKNASWYFSVYKKDLNDKNKRFIRRGFPDRTSARKAEADFLLNFVDDHRILFDSIAREFLALYKQKVKVMVYRGFKGRFDRYVLPYFTNIQIGKIKTRDIISWKTKILALKLSSSTNRNIYIALNQVFDYAWSNYEFDNPCKKVGNFPNRAIQVEKRIISFEDFKKFISTINVLGHRVFFILLYFTGLRKGEALALKWSDVYLKNKIFINKSYAKNILGTPKTQSSVRYIYLPNIVINEIQKLYEFAKPKSMDLYVFGNKIPYSPTTLDRKKQIYFDKAKIQSITFHEFRHSFVSTMLMRSNDISSIMAQVGHNDMETTLNVYAHHFIDGQKKLINLINDDEDIKM